MRHPRPAPDRIARHRNHRCRSTASASARFAASRTGWLAVATRRCWLAASRRCWLAASRRCWLAAALATVWLFSPAPTIADSESGDGSTIIYETLRVGDVSCSIEITGSPTLSVCAGSTLEFSASLECLLGTIPANDPVWLLDGEPVGTGLDLSLVLSPEPGSFLLEVLCGSCQDEVAIEAVDCTLQPRLDALYSSDETEDSAGLFLRKNVAPVSGPDFARYRFAMHPFVLSVDESLDTGSVTLESVGDDVLQLFAEDGAEIPLPVSFDVADLPASFLVNGADHGDGRLRATYSAAAQPEDSGNPSDSHSGDRRGEEPNVDQVRVRVGPWPGLTGRSTDGFPHFLHVDSFNDDGILETAVDPARHAGRIGLPFDVYVVAHRSSGEWALDDTLVDVSGSVESSSVFAGSIESNIVPAWTGGLDPGPLVSASYDVVYDFGQDGSLDPGDLMDGLTADGGSGPGSGPTAGAYVVKDLSLPGPHSVQSGDYSGGTWLTQRVYYPSDIAAMGELPLVTIGHGNGHNYNWYDYLGNHLASHGYVVMSYRNNTGPGIETASTTTLTNLDFLLANLGTIQGGVLDGHLDTARIGWIGHSRGGEGVVRAYDRIHDGAWSPQGYSLEDIQVVSSIAPTVYLTAAQSDPHEVNYYLIVGGADGDVTGRPDLEGDQYFRIADRSLATSLTTYVHGATHNDFNCCGFDDGIGPDQIGRTEAQRVAKSYFLALLRYYLHGDLSTREYFTRMYDDFGPSGIDPSVEIAATYRDIGSAGTFVVDDFQTQPSLGTSSSSGAVGFSVTNAHEGLSEDNNSTYTWLASDPMNGMTYYSGDGDFARSLIFDHASGTQRSIEFEVVAPFRDLRGHRYLSLRACQGTRHPETAALNDSHSFGVTLVDEEGVSSTVPFGSWGRLTRLYPRTGSGSGVGWLNEMNTVRIPLTAFETDGTGIDLSRIASVRLEFGSNHGSDRGRIGLDDLQFLVD